MSEAAKQTEMQREIDSFHAALEREPNERAAFLAARHGDDPALLSRLMRLLAAHERAERVDSIERSDAADPSADRSPSPASNDDMPERIGPYRVLERIGEGGMGYVYAAEQSEPFRRRVAIKVIKLGMDSREVLARFEVERQALAMMDHPGVTTALDAGVTAEGRPYFVMELVKGLPLVEYCIRHRLPLVDRLRLFVQVCTAIQHAHQKGIIHRDLKPTNILVAVQEGRPVPKVIDFGVAKATATRLTQNTVFTELGKLIGTPEYMSPEQAEMSGLDVDTRADVYSLGVILYELLTGLLPFDSKALRSGGYAEILRIIREVDPPRPSTRLRESTRVDRASTDAAAPARSLRGELDWIVMKAIAKDRTRRYGTASALGEDIERYLADLPVLAGPPSFTYTVRKFVTRHRFATGFAALAVLSATAGLTGLTLGLLRAKQAEALATQRADNAQAAADFLERVLFQADPEYGGGDLSLLQVMNEASRVVGQSLGAYPEVEASVRESLGVAYRRRSMFAEATPHLAESLRIRASRFGEENLEVVPSLIAMANLRFEHEGVVDSVQPMLARAQQIYAAHDLDDSFANAWLQLDIGLAQLAGDQLADAARAFERCRELLTGDRGPDHPDISRPTRGLAMVALLRGEVAEARQLAHHAVVLCEGGPAVYIGARAKLVLARVLLETGDFDDAAQLLAGAARQFVDTVGDRHVRIAELAAVQAELQLRRRDHLAAAEAAERCVTLRSQLLHADNPAILEGRLLLQSARIANGDTAPAEAELEHIVEAAKPRIGADHELMVRIASARLDCAIAAGDASLRSIRSAHLADLRGRRTERLRRELDAHARGEIGR